MLKGYGKRISYYRKEKKVTQEDLAKFLNVTPSYISKLENERTPMSLERLGEIAGFLGIDVTDLLENKQEPPTTLKDAGAEWIILGEKLEKRGITPEEVERWAKLVKFYDEN
ncbi:helix-turn-helix transcriptional regulator [Metabacillus fastidiosus]|uniref:Helix-turn-helix transcriptional regulator n=1 Tax=Metabacillus fastidiosus TaxID=1458 RepID=A0ABU6NRQ5_9BACI|nr:helix-turn-helix transcriptional regulator [Metabacillus fastidiosus]